MIYNLFQKFQMSKRGFLFIALDSQMRELTQIKSINFAGLMDSAHIP